MNILSKMKERS